MIRKITPEECKETIIKNEQTVLRERALIRYQIWNNIRNQSRNDRLGLAWLIMNPLVTSLIYVFVFTVMRANLNAVNIIIGITIYRVFSLSVRSGVSSIRDYRGGIFAERISSKILVRGMLGSMPDLPGPPRDRREGLSAWATPSGPGMLGRFDDAPSSSQATRRAH